MKKEESSTKIQIKFLYLPGSYFERIDSRSESTADAKVGLSKSFFPESVTSIACSTSALLSSSSI